MVEGITFYDIAIFTFAAIYCVLITFLIVQLKKREKVARPFMLSLIISFAFDIIGNFLEYNYNRRTEFGTNLDLAGDDLTLITSLNTWGYLIVLVGPMYLIFILEGEFFSNPKIKDKHIISVLQIGLLSTMIIYAIVINVMYPNLSIEERWFIAFFVIYTLIGLITIIQIIFFTGGFLILSKKSTGTLRKYTFIVAIGFVWQFLVSAYYASLLFEIGRGNMPRTMRGFMNFIGIVMLIRLTGSLTIFYGLVRLYTKDIAKK